MQTTVKQHSLGKAGKDYLPLSDVAHVEPDHLATILQCLQTMKNGDFSARLPGSWTGLAGKIADNFNEIVSANEQMAFELKRVGQAVGKEGKTRERLRVEKRRGAWDDMEVSVNTLVEDLLRPTAEVTRAIAAVAQGNLTQTVRLDVDGRPLEGEFLRSANIVNTMIQQLGVFTAEVTRVAREVGTDGKLGGQAQVPGVAGTWKDLTDSVNSMASNLTGQVRNIAEVATAVASGDLSRKITVDVRGEILQLKEAINTMVDQLRSFASEVTRVAREVGTDGKLGGQAVVPGVDNGREHRVLIRNIELLDEAGRLEGVVAIVTDLTERALEHDLDLSGHPDAPKPHHKYHPIVIRNRKVAAALGGLLLFLLMLPIAGIYFSTGKQLSPEEKRLAAAEKEKRESAARFNAMTPAQHIERAKLALRPGAGSASIQDALRNLKVIPPSSPEAARAKTLQKELIKAGNLAQAQSLIDAASNGGVRDGMEKLRKAREILDTVHGQYPNDNATSQLYRQAQAAAEQVAMRSPQEFAAAETKLVDFTWEKGGFGTVMIAKFTVRNDSPVDIADLKIQCQHYDSSGVVLDQNSGTAFGLVKAHATTRIPNVNMGFLNPESGNSRTTKTECEILGLKLASESEALSSTR